MIIKTKSLFLKFPFNNGTMLKIINKSDDKEFIGILINESLNNDYIVLEIYSINGNPIQKEKSRFYYDFIDTIEEL